MLNSSDNQERLDTFLALALAFHGKDAVTEEDNVGKEQSSYALRFLKDLGIDNPSLTERAGMYEKLEQDKQEKWLKRALGSTYVRGRAIHLDKQIHHTHLSQMLRAEPVRIQILILKNLPKNLAEQIASELGIFNFFQEFIKDATSESDLPMPEVASVVRRVFLSNFVTADDLYLLKPLDSLSSVELVNFIHILGARETAIACRGIDNVETVAAFLRRFTPEDARAIASYISNLKDLEPARVLFAEKLIQAALAAGLTHNAMLDRIGSNLIMIALVGSDETRLRYAQQKIPFNASAEIRTMFDAASNEYTKADAGERAMQNFIAREIEYLASAFRKRNK